MCWQPTCDSFRDASSETRGAFSEELALVTWARPVARRLVGTFVVLFLAVYPKALATCPQLAQGGALPTEPASKTILHDNIDVWVTALDHIQLPGDPASRELLTKARDVLQALGGSWRGDRNFVRHSFTRYSYKELRIGLREAALEMFSKIPDNETINFYFNSNMGKSNKWVFHVLYDTLVNDPDPTVRELTSRFRVIDARTARSPIADARYVVYLDDAAYSGLQIESALSGVRHKFRNLEAILVLVPFMTSTGRVKVEFLGAEEGLTFFLPTRTKSGAGRMMQVRDIYQSWPAEIRNTISPSDMQAIFGPNWEIRTLSFF